MADEKDNPAEVVTRWGVVRLKPFRCDETAEAFMVELPNESRTIVGCITLQAGVWEGWEQVVTGSVGFFRQRDHAVCHVLRVWHCRVMLAETSVNVRLRRVL